MSHILDLAIVSLYGYATGLFVIGFTRIVVQNLFADEPATVQPIAIDPVESVPVESVPVATKAIKAKTANKAAKTENISVIPVDNSNEDQLDLEQLKEEAKSLKIKGYNFYKDPVKLYAKIKEVKQQQ